MKDQTQFILRAALDLGYCFYQIISHFYAMHSTSTTLPSSPSPFSSSPYFNSFSESIPLIQVE